MTRPRRISFPEPMTVPRYFPTCSLSEALARRRPRWRSGMTIMELVVAMTVLAAVLATTMAILQLTVNLNRQGRQQLSNVESLDRLSRQFRADVRAASAAGPVAHDDDRSTLPLTHPAGTRIEYRLNQREPARIVRLVRQGETIASREGYELSDWTPSSLAVSSESPPRARLVLSRATSLPADQPAGLAIEAVIGARLPAPQPGDGGKDGSR